MNGLRVAVVVTNDLLTDQRVGRTCDTLVDKGCVVTLVGRILPGSGPIARRYATRRFRLPFRKGPLFYASYNVRLFFFLLCARYDLVVANDTDTLLASYFAVLLRKKAILYDAHELFPDVPELVGRERTRAAWVCIERLVLPRIGRRVRGSAVTVNASLASVFHQRYGLEMSVVRNVPATWPAQPKGRGSMNSSEACVHDCHMLLYQGALNVGRGLEQLVRSLQYLPKWKLVLAGDGDIAGRLKGEVSSLPWRDRIVFLGRVEPHRLRLLTQEADLGWVVMEPMGLNYILSLPNRVGDYVAANVPFLASDFPELMAFLDTCPVGRTIPVRDEVGQLSNYKLLAERIESFWNDWQALPPGEREHRFAMARRFLDWSVDRENLLDAVRKSLSRQNKKASI